MAASDGGALPDSLIKAPAIHRYFRQPIDRRDPDADHGLAFVETVADPEWQSTPLPQQPEIGGLVEIGFSSVKRMVRLDANGRVAAYVEPVAGDGWSKRGTFRGDGVAFMAAKSAVTPNCRSGTRKTGP